VLQRAWPTIALTAGGGALLLLDVVGGAGRGLAVAGVVRNLQSTPTPGP
jgi:hypothetical protein